MLLANLRFLAGYRRTGLLPEGLLDDILVAVMPGDTIGGVISRMSRTRQPGEPPFDWVTGIPWAGPDPDAIRPEDLHPLIRAGLPVRAIAARLGTTADHVRPTAARHPASQLLSGTPALLPPEPDSPGADQLRKFTSQGYGARKIARITGCSERTIRQLLTNAGLRQPLPSPDGGTDPHWLRE